MQKAASTRGRGKHGIGIAECGHRRGRGHGSKGAISDDRRERPLGKKSRNIR